ncbi:MAG: zinc-ribbon domain-containing protein [Deltaproteobacteria bacterium]|nr:zinc-ribbon domain-containing protein [Deltaproteobacteria bacterium]
MQRLTKHYSLTDLEPDLVKEWHPTANGDVNPRNVTIVYRKKVWWICDQGHEWKATVKSRINRIGCPVCKKDLVDDNLPKGELESSSTETAANNSAMSKKSDIISEMDASYQYLGKDFRKNRRYMSRATAIIEIPLSGHWLYAEMNNFSAAGMYFETEAAINPGTKIFIKFDRPLFFSDQKNFSSIIKWCKKLDEAHKSSYDYGLGVGFI